MPRKKPKRRETWSDLRRRTKDLCHVSFLHALKHELPYSPGLDMDAIHRKYAMRKAA